MTYNCPKDPTYSERLVLKLCIICHTIHPFSKFTELFLYRKKKICKISIIVLEKPLHVDGEKEGGQRKGGRGREMMDERE